MLATATLFTSLAIGSLAWIYGSDLAPGPPIRSDALGYYVYLPAVILDRDVTMERLGSERESEIDGLRRVGPRGRYLDKFPVGEAIVLLPFFVGGHLAAVATGTERTGFSKPYQVAAVAGGLTCAVLGIVLLGVLLLRWFSTTTVGVTLVAIVFGTNLFHYATFDAVFSHAFSFFLVAVSMNVAVALDERPSASRAACLGLSTGLLTCVRPTNVVLLVFVALLGVVDRRSLANRLRGLWDNPRLVAVGVGAFLLAITPQLAYWYTITGRLLVNAYEDEHLRPLHPEVAQVLFSVRKGLFFWSPLLVLAVVGLLCLRRSVPGLFLAATVYLAVDTWVIATWQTWWYGDSLGQRPFVEALPVFALGLAALVEAARGRVARPAMLATTGLCTALAVHATIAYWLVAIPYDGTTWRIYLRSFERLYF